MKTVELKKTETIKVNVFFNKEHKDYRLFLEEYVSTLDMDDYVFSKELAERWNLKRPPELKWIHDKEPYFDDVKDGEINENLDKIPYKLVNGNYDDFLEKLIANTIAECLLDADYKSSLLIYNFRQKINKSSEFIEDVYSISPFVRYEIVENKNKIIETHEGIELL